MSYCPKCNFKYNDDIKICPDCECELIDNLDNTQDEIFLPEKNLTQEILATNSKQYVKKSDKYNDLHSSSISLIIVGVFGDLFLILNIFDILPIHFAFEGLSGMLFYGVMGSLLNIFLIGGIVSLKSAKKVKSEIQSEEDFTSNVLSYVTDNYTKISIDKHLNIEDGPTAYFDRVEYIKEVITQKYGELEESYLDSLIEELYQKLYED